MITVYYDIEKQDWFQMTEPNGLFFGASNFKISYVGSRPKHSLPFPVKRNGDTVGPLIGILTGPGKDNTFIGNLAGLRRILRSLQENGAIPIVFTPNSIQEDTVVAFSYFPSLHGWIKLRTPLPNVVYNRIPYRSMEKSPKFNELVSYLKSKEIPFFNPSFFSKWQIYQYLQRNHFVASYLPKTTFLHDKDDLEQMLKKHEDIYIKSSTGHKGISLYRIKQEKEKVVVETPHEKQTYPSFLTFWEKNVEILSKEDFIIQETIQTDTYNGKRYDLRILCHLGENGHYISGVGVRLAGKNGVTTHVPNGGSILPYKFVRSRFNEDTLQKLVYEIGKELMVQTGEIIGEFSIDLGRSTGGPIFIFEINSKPMVFDESDIKKKGLENLTKLLIMKGTNAQVP